MKLDVWSYTDIDLQSKQLYDLAGTPDLAEVLLGINKTVYMGAIDIANHQFRRLQKDDDDQIKIHHVSNGEDVAVITNDRPYWLNTEIKWNDYVPLPSFFIVSVKSGERKSLPIYHQIFAHLVKII